MRKYTIIGVIVLMSISLLGVVGLQLYWINDAIKVKQEQFDRAVNDALLSVVDKLETQEAVSVVTGRMASLKQPVNFDYPLTQQEQPAAAAQPIKKQQPAKAKSRAVSNTPASTPKGSAPVKVSGGYPVSPSTARPASAEQTWIKRHNAGTSGTVIRDKKGQLRLLLTTGDTLSPLKQHQQELIPIHAPEVLSNIKTSPNRPTAVHVFKDIKEGSKIAQLKSGTTFTTGKTLDSLTSFYKIHKNPISFSVDTLRIFASKLDSLHQFTRFTSKIDQVDLKSIESIKIQNDSVFIFKTGSSKPVYISHSGTERVNGARASNRTYQQFSPVVKGRVQEVRVLDANETNALKAAKRASSTAPAEELFTVTPEEAAAHRKQQQKPKSAPERKSATEKVEQKTEKLNDVVQKMMVEYVVKDVPLKERLNADSLQSLLKAELQKQGIDLPFGYWVVSSKKDTVVAQNVSTYKDAALPKYKAALFPNDIIYKSDYLDLFFPDSKSYALKSLWGMLALSVFFTFVIIATFGTTIHIIYKQKKLSEMKNDFINNMTHEFKTPIATISLATDAITNPKIYENPEKIMHYTGIIKQENKRMNVQVENVLQIARLEKNDFKLDFKPVDVHILITKAIESIRLQVEERLGQINIQLNALQHELHSDEVHLFNVICNLLDNANKYSPATPDIKLVTQNVEGGLLIAVEDKGMGMSKETQQRVFDKFYRVPTGNLHNVKGFGLGLSYVKAIVQAHKGNVRLKSEPGKGSRFEIFLPLS